MDTKCGTGLDGYECSNEAVQVVSLTDRETGEVFPISFCAECAVEAKTGGLDG